MFHVLTNFINFINSLANIVTVWTFIKECFKKTYHTRRIYKYFF